MDLNNKVVWITGGARMGLAVAGALAQRGCHVVLSYRKSRKHAEAAAQDIRLQGGNAALVRCDMAKKSDVGRAAQEIVRRMGRLDILVNLSSMYEKGAWEAHMNTNAAGAYHATQAVAPWMKKAGGGRVIHIADWTSTSRRPRYREYGPYYVSKAAIQAIVEAAALELAPKVLVNAIAPGPILPPKGMRVAEYRAVRAATPLRRWGGAEEIAKAVVFLCETDFVTGETIRVDGGRHLY